jgi:hypothetical protein
MIMNTFEFPESVLERAKGITLADLLDTDFTQPWAVSLMGNSCANRRNFEMDSVQEVQIFMALEKILDSIPEHERRDLYGMCSKMVSDRINRKDAKREAPRVVIT